MKTAVFVSHETVKQSLYKDLVTGLMIIFCVYISQDSTWWTFITGGMFIIFAIAQINDAINSGLNKFKTKKDLQTWVDSLEDD